MNIFTGILQALGFIGPKEHTEKVLLWNYHRDKCGVHWDPFDKERIVFKPMNSESEEWHFNMSFNAMEDDKSPLVGDKNLTFFIGDSKTYAMGVWGNKVMIVSTEHEDSNYKWRLVKREEGGLFIKPVHDLAKCLKSKRGRLGVCACNDYDKRMAFMYGTPEMRKKFMEGKVLLRKYDDDPAKKDLLRKVMDQGIYWDNYDFPIDKAEIFASKPTPSVDDSERGRRKGNGELDMEALEEILMKQGREITEMRRRHELLPKSMPDGMLLKRMKAEICKLKDEIGRLHKNGAEDHFGARPPTSERRRYRSHPSIARRGDAEVEDEHRDRELEAAREDVSRDRRGGRPSSAKRASRRRESKARPAARTFDAWKREEPLDDPLESVVHGDPQSAIRNLRLRLNRNRVRNPLDDVLNKYRQITSGPTAISPQIAESLRRASVGAGHPDAPAGTTFPGASPSAAPAPSKICNVECIEIGRCTIPCILPPRQPNSLP